MEVHTCSPRQLCARLFVLIMVVVGDIISKTPGFTLARGKRVLNSDHRRGIVGRYNGNVPPFPQV